jgi:hypothetical protein
MFLKGMSVIGLTSIDEMRYEQFLHSYEVEQSHESVLQSPTDDKFDDKVNMRKALQNSRWKILKLTNNPNRFKFAEDHGDKCKLYDFLSFKTSDFFSPTNKNLLLWSNMLMSHLLTHMCVVPDIQFKAFVCRNPFFSFDLDKISVNLDILSKKMQEFLQETELLRLLTIPLESPSKITRRSLVLHTEFHIRDRGELKNVRHECMVYWELLMVQGVYTLQFGSCDNLSEYELDICIDYSSVYAQVIRDLVRNSKISVHQCNIIPRLGADKHVGVYQCTSICRRCLLYFSLFRDITTLHLNANLERFIDFSRVQKFAANTQATQMYKRNLLAYFYHLHRIHQSFLTNPLLWPDNSTRPPSITRENPVCAVVFYPLYNFSLQQRERQFIPLDARLHMFKLVNLFDYSETFYKFVWGGHSVFEPVPQREAQQMWDNFLANHDLPPLENYSESCVTQAELDPAKLLHTLKNIHARLSLLEKNAHTSLFLF